MTTTKMAGIAGKTDERHGAVTRIVSGVSINGIEIDSITPFASAGLTQHFSYRLDMISRL